MPVKHQIDFVRRDKFEETPSGKLLNWATTFGRWIVVVTDLVVICAFLSRFYFDTKLANLYDDIIQSQAIIQATSSFEDSYRWLQKRLNMIKTISAAKFKAEKGTSLVTALLPPDVSLKTLTLTSKEVNFSGTALSEAGFTFFLRNLLVSPQIGSVNISQISIGGKEEAGIISFTISASWKNL